MVTLSLWVCLRALLLNKMDFAVVLLFALTSFACPLVMIMMVGLHLRSCAWGGQRYAAYRAASQQTLLCSPLCEMSWFQLVVD